MSAMDRHLGHYRRYDRTELRAKLEGAGFNVLALRYFDFPGVVPWLVINRWLGADELNRTVTGVSYRAVVPLARAIGTYPAAVRQEPDCGGAAAGLTPFDSGHGRTTKDYPGRLGLCAIIPEAHARDPAAAVLAFSKSLAKATFDVRSIRTKQIKLLSSVRTSAMSI